MICSTMHKEVDTLVRSMWFIWQIYMYIYIFILDGPPDATPEGSWEERQKQEVFACLVNV